MPDCKECSLMFSQFRTCCVWQQTVFKLPICCHIALDWVPCLRFAPVLCQNDSAEWPCFQAGSYWSQSYPECYWGLASEKLFAFMYRNVPVLLHGVTHRRWLSIASLICWDVGKCQSLAPYLGVPLCPSASSWCCSTCRGPWLVTDLKIESRSNPSIKDIFFFYVWVYNTERKLGIRVLCLHFPVGWYSSSLFCHNKRAAR